jgi:hypothetical protein
LGKVPNSNTLVFTQRDYQRASGAESRIGRKTSESSLRSLAYSPTQKAHAAYTHGGHGAHTRHVASVRMICVAGPRTRPVPVVPTVGIHVHVGARAVPNRSMLSGQSADVMGSLQLGMIGAYILTFNVREMQG